jgi:hypothetical protein
MVGWANILIEKNSRNRAMQPMRKAARSAGLRTPRCVAGRHEAPLWFTGILIAWREIALQCEYIFIVVCCGFGFLYSLPRWHSFSKSFLRVDGR